MLKSVLAALVAGTFLLSVPAHADDKAAAPAAEKSAKGSKDKHEKTEKTEKTEKKEEKGW